MASRDDIPIIDIGPYLLGNDNNDDGTTTAQELDHIVERLRYACTHVGFYYLLGHGISQDQIERMFSVVRQFYDLTLEEKERLRMDRHDWHVGGVGYLPLYHRKLPTRKRGNANEAFVIKRQTGKVNINVDEDNQWPDENVRPGFKD
jgi:isopenicillin N synthase-like dioxygenase